MKKLWVLFLLCTSFIAQAQDTTSQRNKIYYWLDNQLYDQAALYLEDILKDSSDVEIVNDLARSYYFMKDYNRAIKLLDNTLKKKPYDITANRFMANIYELQQSFVNAVPYLRRLTDTLQNSPLLYRELGNIYLAENNIDSGKFFLEKAYAYGNNIPAVVASYADYFIKAKQYDEGEKILYTYFSHDSLNIEVIDRMINVADVRNRYDSIIHVANKYFGKIGSNINTNALVLKAYIYSNKADSALLLGNQLLDKRILNEKLFYFLGVAYGEKYNFDSSQYFIQRAIEFGLSPNVESYWLQIAKYAEHSNKYELAKNYRDTAYYLFQNPVSLFWNGMMYARGKVIDKQNAKKYFTAALQPSTSQNSLPKNLEEFATMWLKENL